MWARVKKFISDDSGVVWVEALIAIPLLTVITIGVLEFGTMMWQREQLQNGVRDAARYWARCRPTFMACTQAEARNIAFFGDPRGNTPANPRPARVPGWYTGGPGAVLTIQPATPPAFPGPDDIVIVEGRVAYQGSPLYTAILQNGIELGYFHTQRYIGW